jgi:hypothetical protein
MIISLTLMKNIHARACRCRNDVYESVATSLLVVILPTPALPVHAPLIRSLHLRDSPRTESLLALHFLCVRLLSRVARLYWVSPAAGLLLLRATANLLDSAQIYHIMNRNADYDLVNALVHFLVTRVWALSALPVQFP